MSDDDLRFETRAIHVGQDPDVPYGSVNVPIYQTATYAQPGVGEPKAWDYARAGNPTREAFQQALASLEGGERAFAFASGLGAESTLLLSLGPGDHVVLGDDVYGGTYRLLAKVFAPWGVAHTTCDLGDGDALRAAIRDETRLVWLETPSNPLLKVVDVVAVAAVARVAAGVEAPQLDLRLAAARQVAVAELDLLDVAGAARQVDDAAGGAGAEDQAGVGRPRRAVAEGDLHVV